jgi:hypothetical protein
MALAKLNYVLTGSFLQFCSMIQNLKEDIQTDEYMLVIKHRNDARTDSNTRGRTTSETSTVHKVALSLAQNIRHQI